MAGVVLVVAGAGDLGSLDALGIGLAVDRRPGPDVLCPCRAPWLPRRARDAGRGSHDGWRHAAVPLVAARDRPPAGDGPAARQRGSAVAGPGRRGAGSRRWRPSASSRASGCLARRARPSCRPWSRSSGSPWRRILFGTVPTPLQFAGGALIIAAGIVLQLRARRGDRGARGGRRAPLLAPRSARADDPWQLGQRSDHSRPRWDGLTPVAPLRPADEDGVHPGGLGTLDVGSIRVADHQGFAGRRPARVAARRKRAGSGFERPTAPDAMTKSSSSRGPGVDDGSRFEPQSETIPSLMPRLRSSLIAGKTSA